MTSLLFSAVPRLPAPHDGERPSSRPGRTSPADDLLREARQRLWRLTPQQARDAQTRGTLLVDIRPLDQRLADGEIPDALVVERTELEWRLDPGPGPQARDVVVVCSDGRASSLAAASLQLLGLARVSDVEGGFGAWRAAGLPVVSGGTPAGGRSRNDPLHVDVERWEARVAGELLALTSQEFRVLSSLYSAGGRVVTRTGLAQLLDVYPAGSRALDVHVCRLRRKLGPARQQLVTVRGVGWRLLTT